MDLPEPLFALSLRDYRRYAQNRGKQSERSLTFHPHPDVTHCSVKYAENDFPLLRSKIRALYPVHRATLGTLLRHLLRVSSRSNKNAMTVEALATRFSYTVLRTGNAVLQEGVDVKARYYNLCKIKLAHSRKDTCYGGSHSKCAHPV